MTVDLTALWHTNRRWRAWMDANTKFVTPDTLDCLRYALIESCEALDSWMRARLPDHARNNGRDHTVESELADTAMLLLTALTEFMMNQSQYRTAKPIVRTLDDICLAAAESAYYCSTDTIWEDKAYLALLMVVGYPGLDLPAELDRCHRRLAIKHGMGALSKWLHSQGEIEASIGYIYYKEDTGNWWHVPWFVEES